MVGPNFDKKEMLVDRPDQINLHLLTSPLSHQIKHKTPPPPPDKSVKPIVDTINTVPLLLRPQPLCHKWNEAVITAKNTHTHARELSR